MAFILFFTASVYACVPFYLRRTFCLLYAEHVQLFSKNISIRVVRFKIVGGLDWIYVTESGAQWQALLKINSLLQHKCLAIYGLSLRESQLH